MKKKPLSSVKDAHGSSVKNGQPCWINSVASLVNTDRSCSFRYVNALIFKTHDISFIIACVQVPVMVLYGSGKYRMVVGQ